MSVLHDNAPLKFGIRKLDNPDFEMHKLYTLKTL